MNITPETFSTLSTRKAALLLIVLISLAALACESHSVAGGPVPIFPEGNVTNEEVEKLIRFVARVEKPEIAGDKLFVDVNQSWMSSPPGLRERSMAKWYGMWQAAHGGTPDNHKKGVDVVARFEGKEVAHWTSDGYRWLEGPKSEQAESK